MSRHIIISPTQNLIQEVVAQLPDGTNDFSRFIIVFPGKRPAHFVRKALANRIGDSFIPPQIFSIDSFVDELIETKLGLRQTALEDLDAVALLFDIHMNLPERLGAGHFQTIDRFIGLGLKLFGELEELVMADVDVRRVSEAMANVPLARIHTLPEYFSRFYSAVREKGLTTRAMRYKQVADAIATIDLSEYKAVLLAGFYAFTSVEQRIFRDLVRRDNAVVIAQRGPGIGRRLETIGVDIETEEAPTPEHGPVCHFYQSSDTHGQVFAVTQKIKAMLDSGTPVDEKTVMVLPTADALFPVVHHTLPLLSPDQYNISLGYPLQRTPLYGFFLSLLTLSAGARNGAVPISKYTAFILHPYTKNMLFGRRADVTRVLIHALETHLARGQSKMYVSLEELEGQNKLFEEVSAAFAASGTDISPLDLKHHLQTVHDQALRPFLVIKSLGDFASKSTGLLHYVHRHSTATRHPFFRPYAERLIELFDSINRSMLAGQHLADSAAYVAFFRNVAATESVPFPGTPLKGLQVIGLLETRNLSFDTVFLLNATDDVIPGAHGHDVLLPQPLREVLGLETYRDRERLSEYYFSTLLAGAREVHCFFTESGKHEKSRFIEKLLWQQQRANRSLDLGNLVQVVRYNVQLATSRPNSIEKTRDVVEHLKRFEYTATALDAYRACPLRFYYAHVLRLAEKEAVSEDLEQSEIGSFVHDVLKSYFDGMIGHSLTPADVDLKRLQLTIDRLFAEQYGTDLVGPALLVKQQVTRQLSAFIEKYQLPLVKSHPVKIVGLEQRLSVLSDGHRFAGRIDRIERRGDRHIILDYKTGRDDKRVRINLSKLVDEDPDSWRDAIGSFQLVLYMLLYSKSNRVPIDLIDPSYLFLGRNEIAPDIEIGIGGKQHTAEEVYLRVYPVMVNIINEILDAQRPFEPTARLEKACPECPYNTICGTSWTSGQ